MPTPTLQQARNHHAERAALAAAGAREVADRLAQRRPWAEVLTAFAVYQLRAASAAIATMAGWADRPPAANPAAFAGVTSYGFAIAEPLVSTIDRVIPAPVEPLPAPWWEPSDAEVATFLRQIEQLVASEVADAARTAAQVEMVSHDEFDRYIRLLVPPSCKRCVPLANRIYKDLDGFERHPLCFPEGVVASGPAIEGATRRWFEGEVVILTTASGQELPLTGNHPVLTRRGWVPANLVHEGDEVFRSTRPEGASALVVPDHDQMPACVEDLWSAFRVGGLHRVPSTAQHFHGDGQQGEVDVVRADRALDRRTDPGAPQHLLEMSLALALRQSHDFSEQRRSQLLQLGDLATSGSLVRGRSLGAPLFVGHRRGAYHPSLAHAAARHPGGLQGSLYGAPRDSVLAGERVLTGSSFVGRHDGVPIERDPRPRWDAPTLPDLVEQRRAYAEIGLDLVDRLAGQVEPDRVVFSRSIEFRGHVYSLTSSEGWHAANELIVSNCDCIHVPVASLEEARERGLVQDPQRLVEQGQVRGLSQADAQAILDGADATTVINATAGTRQPGITNALTTEVFGRRVKATTYGTTRRAAWRQQNPSRLVRLRPESIYANARDHDDALRLLRLYGYLNGG